VLLVRQPDDEAPTVAVRGRGLPDPRLESRTGKPGLKGGRSSHGKRLRQSGHLDPSVV
jgi:hypothetical protein